MNPAGPFTNSIRSTMTREQLYSGKAKTIYKTDDPDTLITEFRNSLTAFNGEKKGEMEKKGYYNAQISKKIFEMLEAEGIKTHFVEMLSDIDMLVKKVEIIKIEVIVRNIAAGSITKRYPIKEGTVFKTPVLVFDFKNDEYGDPMGARPIALMDPLYFGPLDTPKNMFLFEQIIKGIAGYGNCIGVPVVNGETFFDKKYSGNPLVNVVAVGLCREKEVITARSQKAGNKLVLAGSSTGKDGLGGASFASRDLSESAEAEDRPSVQVGDPYTEKLVIEMTLEAMQKDFSLFRDLKVELTQQSISRVSWTLMTVILQACLQNSLEVWAGESWRSNVIPKLMKEKSL